MVDVELALHQLLNITYDIISKMLAQEHMATLAKPKLADKKDSENASEANGIA